MQLVDRTIDEIQDLEQRRVNAATLAQAIQFAIAKQKLEISFQANVAEVRRVARGWARDGAFCG